MQAALQFTHAPSPLRPWQRPRRHEAVDHVAVPLIVSLMVLAPVGGLSKVAADGLASRVFTAAVAVELANSVLAPVLAQLGVSKGCFRDRFFGSPEPVQTSVQVGYCMDVSYFAPSACTGAGDQWHTYPAGATYTPPFRFDAERCISSIITVYTPEWVTPSPHVNTAHHRAGRGRR